MMSGRRGPELECANARKQNIQQRRQPLVGRVGLIILGAALIAYFVWAFQGS
jgi:hypothetical protein